MYDASVPSPLLQASPYGFTRGSTVTASWSGVVRPTRTWIGLFARGANNTAYVA